MSLINIEGQPPFLTLDSKYEITYIDEGLKQKYPAFSKANFFKTLLGKYPKEKFSEPLSLNVSPFFTQPINLIFCSLKDGGLKCFPVCSEDYTTLSGQSSIHYQMREPLSGIFALLPLLSDNINNTNTEKAQSNLNGIYSEAYLLLKNINNITFCSKILSGQLPGVDTIDFSSVVESVAGGVSTVVKNANIITAIQPGINIEGNLQLLSNAVINLISNSLHFKSDENVEINISLKSQGKTAVLSYSDNSKGILDENLSLIFQPYFSKDPFGDDDISPSLGLGLFIVKTAFEQAGGNIIVSSQFGKGVRYSVSFPLVKEALQVLESSPSDFLLNRYSDLFVQLCDVCTLPILK